MTAIKANLIKYMKLSIAGGIQHKEDTCNLVSKINYNESI